MNWSVISTVANVFGFLFLFAAIALITTVESAKLGEFASKFVATLLALSVYYGVTSFGEGIVPELPAIKFEFLKYAVPIVGTLGLIVLAVMVIRNWSAEMDSVKKSGARMLLVAVCAVAARILLSF